MAEVFPVENPTPEFPYVFTPRWETLVSKFESGLEQRRQRRQFPAYDVSVTFNNVFNPTDMQNQWDFFMARKGSAESFWFYDMYPGILITTVHYAQFIGVGDGIVEIFDIPGKNTSAVTIYGNGVEVDSGDYTLLSGGGDGDSDRVEFDDPVVSGTVVSCDFTGSLRAHVRFDSDAFNRELFAYNVSRFSLNLKGIFPI